MSIKRQLKTKPKNMNDNLNNTGEENIGDIFDLQADSFINPSKSKVQVFYQPQADEGREGIYKSVVRFLPFHKNPNKSKIQKYYVWINNVVDGEAFSVDCPSTIGKKSIL